MSSPGCSSQRRECRAGERWREWPSWAANAGKDQMLPCAFYSFVADMLFAQPDNVALWKRLFAQTGRYTAMPEMLITTGSMEVLRTGTTALARALEAGGAPVTFHEYPQMFHGFEAFYHIIPEADAAMTRIVDFLSSPVQARR